MDEDYCPSFPIYYRQIDEEDSKLIEITISDPDIDFKPGYLDNKNHSTHSITVDGVELEIEGGIWLK